MNYKLTFQHRTESKTIIVKRESEKLQKAIDYFAPLGYDAHVSLITTTDL